MKKENQLTYTKLTDKKRELFLNREKDWRNGGIVYQIFVDRFVPSADLKSKTHLYQSPRSLQDWQTLPQRGFKDAKTRYWTHELAFWGGDLKSTTTKIDYLKTLGVQTVYLNPIFDAYSNHKYDTYNYEVVSPEYGNLNDLSKLIQQLKDRGMQLVLDGVFNHMAIESPRFLEASKTNSPYRDWFVFGNQFPTGFRLWHNAPSLPELNLQNDKVREYLFSGPNSIVKRYIKLGVAGWRLDTAIELGYDYLTELTEAAHEVNPQSLVVGELNNYPQGWSPSMDATMLLPLRDLIIQTIRGNVSSSVFSANVEQMIQETGMDTMLKSWVLLENHDLGRIATDLKNWSEYQLAKTLQFTLPATINLYMGEEIGTQGGDDPLNRATMNWQVVEKGNEYLTLHRNLIRIRQQERSLRIGDIKFLHSNNLIAYLRTTDQVEETLVVIVNPHDKPIKETILVTEPMLKSHNHFVDLITGKEILTSYGILLPIEIPAKTSWILKPNLKPINGYTPYKNIKGSF
jgi:glycosidase